MVAFSYSLCSELVTMTIRQTTKLKYSRGLESDRKPSWVVSTHAMCTLKHIWKHASFSRNECDSSHWKQFLTISVYLFSQFDGDVGTEKDFTTIKQKCTQNRTVGGHGRCWWKGWREWGEQETQVLYKGNGHYLIPTVAVTQGVGLVQKHLPVY